MNKSSQSYGVSPAIWVHLVLQVCHPTQVNLPCLTQPDRPLLDLPTPEGMEGLVNLRGWLHIQMVYLPTDGCPSKY